MEVMELTKLMKGRRRTKTRNTWWVKSSQQGEKAQILLAAGIADNKNPYTNKAAI